MAEPLAAIVFAVDPSIRYVAVNQGGRIVEMEQRAGWPSHNPPETDRMEEVTALPRSTAYCQCRPRALARNFAISPRVTYWFGQKLLPPQPLVIPDFARASITRK